MIVFWFDNERKWWENKNLYFGVFVLDMGENIVRVFIMIYREKFEVLFRFKIFIFF